MRKRNVAYKLWISQLLNGRYVREESEPSYIDLNGKKIARANIVASVVGKFVSEDGNYASITIDDGSHEIRLKSWGDDTRLLKDISVGGIVLVIGRPREYNEERYMTPELVRTVDDANWEIARKLELLKGYGFVRKENEVSEKSAKEDYSSKKEYTEEKIEGTSNETRNIVLSAINSLNNPNGVNINDIASKSGLNEKEVNNVIDELIRDGELYRSRAGFVNLV